MIQVVPEKLKNEILQHCHDDKVAGHLGKDKTIQRIKQYFIWHQMGSDITNYVLTCNICNRYKNAHVNPRHALQAYHAGSPMERLHIDILEPFNQSDDKHCYVLMMIDQFTKWVEMAAIPVSFEGRELCILVLYSAGPDSYIALLSLVLWHLEDRSYVFLYYILLDQTVI